eukprot:Skav201573  [mRNA]  locus=scaffold152:113362:114210:+ [translate_table: standard]
MLIFGGVSYDATTVSFLNDLHLYLAETNEWQELSPNGTAPQARSHHSAVWIDVLNGMVIFGGEFCPDLLSTTSTCEQFNDLNLYLPESNQWQELQPSGSIPLARRSPSALWIDALKGMLVCGGKDRDRTKKDMFLYDPQANKWEELDLALMFGRAGHTTVWIEGVNEKRTMANGTLLFGGFTTEWGPLSYMTETFLWNLHNNEGDGPGYGYGPHGYQDDSNGDGNDDSNNDDSNSDDNDDSNGGGNEDSNSDGNDGNDGNAGRAGVAVPGVVASFLLSIYLF